VDLGLGNLRSVVHALERAGAQPRLTADPEAVARADRLVVPGQGGFAAGAAALDGGLSAAIREGLARGVPYLGICLGMQLLFEGSDEAPGARGLGVVPGAVRRFPAGMADGRGGRLKIPHMGWNVVEGSHPLLPAQQWFYFVHSYRCEPADPDVSVGTADYGGSFCAAVARDAWFACQFHPEKSHAAGARLLTRFLEGGWS
jgi:glutamine amidotransferase